MGMEGEERYEEEGGNSVVIWGGVTGGKRPWASKGRAVRSKSVYINNVKGLNR